jgi:hypothetical protein
MGVRNDVKSSSIVVKLEQAGELNDVLVRFWDLARELPDARSIATLACRIVVEKLGAERAYWAELD